MILAIKIRISSGDEDCKLLKEAKEKLQQQRGQLDHYICFKEVKSH
jgi:hypothetical protein